MKLASRPQPCLHDGADRKDGRRTDDDRRTDDGRTDDGRTDGTDGTDGMDGTDDGRTDDDGRTGRTDGRRDVRRTNGGTDGTEGTTHPHQPTPPQLYVSFKDLLTDTDSLFWVFVDEATSQLRAQAHPKKTTNTLIRPFTSMRTWTNGEVEEKEMGANDCSFKFVFASTDETVFLLQEGKKQRR
jgi:hypothetical protein